VCDHDGQSLAYVYFEEEPGWRAAAKLLTKNEAWDQGQYRGDYGCGPQGAAWRSLISWVITRGRNFEAKPSTKSLFANTAAQCARRSASDDLVNCPGVGLEVADEVLIVASLRQCRESALLMAFK
jgi:hypothetical protein